MHTASPVDSVADAASQQEAQACVAPEVGGAVDTDCLPAIGIAGKPMPGLFAVDRLLSSRKIGLVDRMAP